MAYSDGTTIYWDRAYLRAWLTITYDGMFTLPVSYGLKNEPILFEVFDDTGTSVTSGTSYTNNYGMATFTTGDLTNDTGCELFTFKASWDGHSVGVGGGMVVTADSQEDSEDMYLCEGTSPVTGMWDRWGGVYVGALNNVAFEFTVPIDAVPTETLVEIQEPMYVPDNTGMDPYVPGAAFAFELLPIPLIDLQYPVVVSLEYPEDLITNNPDYGPLGECSLRGYWYDPINMSWELMASEPVKINRDTHRISFSTTHFGLLCIAAEWDSDQDGLGAWQEDSVYGTDWAEPDSDLDGVNDGDEVWFNWSDPNDAMKMIGSDQHDTADDLEPGMTVYVAARLFTPTDQSDVSNSPSVIVGVSPKGDMNCDCDLNFIDIEGFVYALIDPATYEIQYPDCDRMLADMNDDGAVNVLDIEPFIDLFIP
jgi:hypothetical protein